MLFSFESKWLKDRLRYGIGTGLSTSLKAHCEVLCAKIKTLLASSTSQLELNMQLACWVVWPTMFK